MPNGPGRARFDGRHAGDGQVRANGNCSRNDPREAHSAAVKYSRGASWSPRVIWSLIRWTSLFQEAIRCRSLSARSWVLPPVVSQLPLPPLPSRGCGAGVVVKLRLRLPGCLLALPPPARTQAPQAARRRNLVGARVGHHDRDRQRSRRERRDHGLAHQLAEPERRGGARACSSCAACQAHHAAQPSSYSRRTFRNGT
jgi:hypothetical protein